MLGTMRLFTMPSRPIERFDSSGVVVDLLPGLLGESQITVAHVAAGGTIGAHPTAHRQLLAVVSGVGQVRGEDGTVQGIGPGSLVLWDTGESHQTWATTDLVAVVVEAVGVIDLARRFPEGLDDHANVVHRA